MGVLCVRSQKGSQIRQQPHAVRPLLMRLSHRTKLVPSPVCVHDSDGDAKPNFFKKADQIDEYLVVSQSDSIVVAFRSGSDPLDQWSRLGGAKTSVK